MKCEECGEEMREENGQIGMGEEGKLPPKKKHYACVNKDCDNYAVTQYL